MNMGDHTDPGLLSVGPIGTGAGMQVRARGHLLGDPNSTYQSERFV